MLGVLAYGIRAQDAYYRLSPLSWELLSHNTFRIMLQAVYALYLFPPALVVAVGIWRLVVQEREDRRILCGQHGPSREGFFAVGSDQGSRRRSLPR